MEWSFKEFSGENRAWNGTQKMGGKFCKIWGKEIYFSRKAALAELLGIVKVQPSLKNTIPMKVFNEISITPAVDSFI